MAFLLYAKDIFVVSIILGLFVVGMVVALKSGVVEKNRDRGRMVLNNASQLIVALAGCVAFLLMVQQMVGIRIGLPW